MEDPRFWDLLTSCLSVSMGWSREACWDFLVHMRVVVDGDQQRAIYQRLRDELKRELESPYGWPTGPSVSAVFAGRVAEAAISGPESWTPDPGGRIAETARDQFQRRG